MHTVTYPVYSRGVQTSPQTAAVAAGFHSSHSSSSEAGMTFLMTFVLFYFYRRVIFKNFMIPFHDKST